MVTWTAARWWCWAMITHKSKENRSFPTICDLGEHTSADCWCHLFYYWHFFAPGMMGDYLTWHTRKKQFLKVWLNDDINLGMASKKSLDWKPHQNLTWIERCWQTAHLRPKTANSFSGWTTVKWEIVLQVAVSYYADLQMTQLITRLSWNDPWSTPHHLAAKCVPPYLLLSSCCFHKQQLTFMHGTTHFILRLLNEDKQGIWC